MFDYYRNKAICKFYNYSFEHAVSFCVSCWMSRCISSRQFQKLLDELYKLDKAEKELHKD